MSELGYDCCINIFCDLSAAIQHPQGLGLGRREHISLKTLYLEELLSRGVFAMYKAEGTKNISDILTKSVENSTLERLLNSKLWKLHASPTDGRMYSAMSKESDIEIAYIRMCLSRLVSANHYVLR